MSTSISLSSLPLDLLPAILAPLTRRRDLFNLALVCREWNDVATRLLYTNIRCFGRDLTIVPLLFRSLTESPRLCRLIRTLEMRVFPISLKVQERLEWERQAVRVLEASVNLRELRWTRKGSITDAVLEAICTLPQLRLFELNAHTNLSPGSWSVDHLLHLPKICSLALVLPDRAVASALTAILAHQAGGLTELTVLSRESPVINDDVMTACIPVLAHSNLSTLALAGCSKLTGAPLLRLLPTLPLLQHLALEGTSVAPSFYSLATPHLSSLISIKITHPGPRHATFAEFFPALATLLGGLPRLDAFTLYHSGSAAFEGIREWPILDVGFVEELSRAVGARLRKFECSGVLMRIGAVEALACPQLRDLVIHMGYDFDLQRLGEVLPRLEHLRTLHVMCQRTDVKFEDVRWLVTQSSRTLLQIGFRNQVWLIRHEPVDPSSPEADFGPSGQDLPHDGLVCGGERVRFVETAEAFGAFRRARYGAENDSVSADDG